MRQYTYTEIKELYQLAEELGIEQRDLVENILEGETDFEVNNYRFIQESEALDILVDMYEGDEYILGCFNADFIAEHTDIPYDAVVALQKADGYEELGKLILSRGIDDMIEAYVSADGYGHAFRSYDHNYEEVELLGTDYIYFRI